MSVKVFYRPVTDPNYLIVFTMGEGAPASYDSVVKLIGVGVVPAFFVVPYRNVRSMYQPI